MIGLYGITIFSVLSAYIYRLINATFLYFTFFTFLEYFFFTSILWLNIFNKRLRLIIVMFSILFIGFQVVSYFITLNSKTQSNEYLDSFSIGIETILIFIYISFFFYESFKNLTDEHIYTKPCFWVTIGMLVYLGGTFFFNILLNHMDQSQVAKYWYLTYIADTIKNVFFCVAMIIYARFPYKEKSLHQSSVPFLDLDMN
jgi:hypothetical protein